MALRPLKRAHPDGGLQCRCPWRQQEEEQEESWRKQAADWSFNRCSGSGRGPERARQTSAQQRSDPGSCPVHPGARHSASECCEILKLVEHVSKRCEQASKDDSSLPCRSAKEKVSDADVAAAEKELGYQTQR
jgi:hypothetical protein